MAAARFRPIILAAVEPAGPAANPGGAVTDVNGRRIALDVTDAFVIPVYRTLSLATETQVRAWELFTAQRDAADFASLRAAYHAVCDAWARAQIMRTGPITLFLRYERFAYWPEARNVTQRTLDALLAGQNPEDLTAENLANNAVAAQGLTALERLLYDGDPVAALTVPEAAPRPGAAGAWRGQVGLGIARNLDRIAHEVLAGWTDADGMRAMIAADRGWAGLFTDGAEAARLLLTDLVTAFGLMHDLKLLPVMGESVDVARPRMAEAWRSNRSTRDLALNLEAAREMERAFARTVIASRRDRIDIVFDAAVAAVAALPADLGEAAADPARRADVENARAAIKLLQLEIAEILPAELGITLGFNALDGD